MKYNFHKLLIKINLLFCFLFIIFSKNVFASDIFQSDYYIVEFQSTNIENNKMTRINEIKKNSLDKIFKKLLINKDYKIIKRKINNDFVDSFILNILINEEKIINENYYAKIKINFNQEFIINYLRLNKFNYVEYEPKNFLTIIFDENNISKKLLSTDNQYYKFLLNNNKDLFNFYLLPNLDINDRFLLKKKDILTLDSNNFEKIISKYNNNNLIFIHSINKNESIFFKVYLYNKNSFDLVDSFSVKKINFNSFFEDLIPKILNQWKKNNFISTSSLNIAKCKIKTLNIYELKKIKNLINSSLIIKELILKNISLNSNTYIIKYYGNNDTFINSLNRKNIRVNYNEKICNISLK